MQTLSIKTFLFLHAQEVADAQQLKELNRLMLTEEENKVEKVLSIYKACGVDYWSASLKKKYYDSALQHLDQINVAEEKKIEIRKLADYLLQRES